MPVAWRGTDDYKFSFEPETFFNNNNYNNNNNMSSLNGEKLVNGNGTLPYGSDEKKVSWKFYGN